MAKPNPLAPLVRRYVESDPQAAARVLETLPEEDLVAAMRAMPPSVTAKAMPHLQAGYAARLLEAGPAELFPAVARELEPEFTARVFARLTSEGRARLLPHLDERLRMQVQEHLTFPNGSVGQVMSPRYVAFKTDLAVRDAVAKLRKDASKNRQVSYAYGVDDDQRLVGVLSTYDMLLAAPGTKIADLVRPEVFSVGPFDDPAAVGEELAKRRYFAAPVVDGEGRLLGVVKAEQLLKGVKNEVAEDIQKMFGVGAEERAFSALGFSLRKRLPWLHVNLVTAFLAAAVVALFEDVIAQVTVLAVFLPVVAGQGGNAGAQSLAVVMRGLVMREIPRDRVRALIVKESVLGLVNGVVIGLVTALVAWLWVGNAWLGLVVGLGMVVNLACAGLAGASIPIAMKKLGLDPAQCSSIMLTTVTDVVGFFSFLGFAVLFQARLT
jgi:magnesium transporter